MDANKAYEEKVWWQLHKNAMSSVEQVLEATPHKTAVVWPPATHHETIQIRWTRHAEHKDEEVRVNS